MNSGDRENLDKTEAYLKTNGRNALALLNRFEILKNNGGKIGNTGIYNYTKGPYYLGINSSDSTEYYVHQILVRANRSYNNKQTKDNGLFPLYKQQENTDSMAKYDELWNIATDSSYAHTEIRDLQQLHTVVAYNRREQLAQKKEYQLKISIIITISIAIILSLILLLLYMQHELKCNRLKIREINYAINILTLLKREFELFYITEQQGPGNNKQLKDLQYEMEILLEKLSCNQSKNLPSDRREKAEEISDSFIIRHLHRLCQKGMIASYTDWQSLYQHFEKYDATFLEFLKMQKTLKERDLNICLLARRRFLPSEMACLLNVSPQVITNIRAKLLCKLYHIKGGAQSFDEKIRKT